MEWNLIAEWTAGLYVVIVIVYLRKTVSMSDNKEKIFLGLTYSVLISIILNLASSYLSYDYKNMPLWILNVSMVLYYLVIPLVSMACFYYAASVIYCKRANQTLSKSWIIGLVPYAIYVVIILSNGIFKHIFEITKISGYVHKEMYQSPFVASGVYALAMIFLALKNRKELDKEVTMVICAFPFFSMMIAVVQVFNYEIVLSGTAMCGSILVIHLYLQVVQRTTDKLTGILNRDTLILNIGKRIGQGKPFSLIMFSIRNFKGLNERMGLEYGDHLLEEIASYFKIMVPKDNVYRYSGDEFAIVFDGDYDDQSVSDRIFLRFKSIWVIDGSDCNIEVVRAKIDFPKFGDNIKDLMSAIDYSIAKLKTQSGETTYLQDSSIYNQMRRQNYIIARLKDAISNDGIEVYYQPIYSAKKNVFTQAEALMRLKNNHTNQINPLYPNEFIPVAEETGLIIEITYKILEIACADLRRFIDKNGSSLGLEAISVNVPYVQFLQSDVVTRFMEILGKSNILSDQIKIEITERTLVADTDTVKNVMTQMQELGFVFEIDDFGIDYSNISLFMQLPIDVVKLDRSLITTAIKNDKNKRFFECLVEGVKALDTVIIAEGVEDEDTLKYILGCGCDCVQGFVFSRPLPYDDFIIYLSNFHKQLNIVALR